VCFVSRRSAGELELLLHLVINRISFDWIHSWMRQT
jgi:hypothetical protein